MFLFNQIFVKRSIINFNLTNFILPANDAAKKNKQSYGKGLRSPVHPETTLFKTVIKIPQEEVIVAYDSDEAQEVEEKKTGGKPELKKSTSMQPTKVNQDYM